MSSLETRTILDDLREFYRNYYADEIAELAQAYPHDDRSLTVAWRDLYQALPEFADDLREHPHGGIGERDPLEELHDALQTYDLAADISLDREGWPAAHVRIHLPDSARLGVGDLRSRHAGRYVAIHGQIDRVTSRSERVKLATFECVKCHNRYDIPQPRHAKEEPQTCNGSCSGKPSFNLIERTSTLVDQRKLRLKQPPEQASGDGAALTVYLEDDRAFLDGDATLPDMTGERVTVHGILRRDPTPWQGRNGKPEFDSYLEGHELTFENSVAATVDTSDHADAVAELTDREDTLEYAVDHFAPAVAGGERMAQIKRAAVLYLFGGVRKDRPDGTAQRGDIHLLMVGDPSTGKTSILDFIEAVSPRVERLSGTDATGVGLTAAAQQDEFADGDWTLKPGVLPRASGGHAIIDELDKIDAGDNLHEALESQRIHVAKAGLQAELKTEAGVVAAANPVHGRFGEDWGEMRQEIDLDPALFSRFDVIHTLVDRPDADVDADVADAALLTAQSNGSDTIPPDVWQAWIAEAKRLRPTLSDAARDAIREWYVEERGRVGSDEERVPLTARGVASAVRLAEAHARLNLRETVTKADAEVAIDVKRAVMGDVYLDDDLKPNADVVTGVESQQERIKSVVELIRKHEPIERAELLDLATDRGMDADSVDHEIDKLKQQGTIIQPETHTFRTA